VLILLLAKYGCQRDDPTPLSETTAEVKALTSPREWDALLVDRQIVAYEPAFGYSPSSKRSDSPKHGKLHKRYGSEPNGWRLAIESVAAPG
jgi:hypothetical protein